MRSSFVALALVVGIADIAGAQPATPSKDEPPGFYTAATLSFAATAVPVLSSMLFWDDGKDRLDTTGRIVLSAGLVLGPSAGHCYAGRCWTAGLGVRLVGSGVIAAMVARDHYEPLDAGTVEVGALLVYGLLITGIVLDATTLRAAIHRRNGERALVVAPLIRDGAAGLALVGTL